MNGEDGMTITRRKLLAAAAAGTAAASVAAIPAATLAAPAVVRPFVWYHSYDGEIYSESFKTMEAAMRFLKAEGDGMIAECQQQDFHIDVDGSSIIELLYGQNEELIGDGEFFECTAEQERELGDMVSAAVEQWVAKNKIDITAWTFGEVRNKITMEEVRPPKPTQTAPDRKG